MPASLHPGRYKIVSIINPEYKRPTGVNHTKEAFQHVRLDLPVQTWEVKQVPAIVVRFSLDEYSFTGVKDDKLIVSVFQEDEVDWLVTRYDEENAYTIQLMDDPSKGWMVSPEFSPNPHIVIAKITPEHIKEHLFQFVPANED